MAHPAQADKKRRARLLILMAASIAAVCLIAAIAREVRCGSVVFDRSSGDICRCVRRMKLGLPLWLSMAVIVYARLRWR